MHAISTKSSITTNLPRTTDYKLNDIYLSFNCRLETTPDSRFSLRKTLFSKFKKKLSKFISREAFYESLAIFTQPHNHLEFADLRMAASYLFVFKSGVLRVCQCIHAHATHVRIPAILIHRSLHIFLTVVSFFFFIPFSKDDFNIPF